MHTYDTSLYAANTLVMISNQSKSKSKSRPSAVFLRLALSWSAVILILGTWDYVDTYSEIVGQAKSWANESFSKDLLYRRWATLHGGVYVPATPETPANPYLTDVQERDIVTPSGKKLTLINPAYMLRQVYELESAKSDARVHLTSLKPIRPENAPDAWEARALRSIESGEKEVSSIEEFGDQSYLRFMRPLMTEVGCLKCHAKQGYKLGDIRGGVSVSIPWTPYRETLRSELLHHILRYGGIWAIGILGLRLGRKQIDSHISERKQAEKALQTSEARYRTLVDWSPEPILVHRHGNIVFANPAASAVFAASAAEELIGRRMLDLVHQDYRASWQDRLSKIVDQDVDLPMMERKLLRLDGTTIIAETKGTSIEFEGKPAVHLAIRDITERKREERLLVLEHAIARSLAVETDAASGLKAVMRNICKAMEWARSTYWRVDETAGVMRFAESWSVPTIDLERYAEGSRSIVFPPGVGLVGRVWESGKPIWVADFGADPRVVQKALAQETGIRGVFVFPVTTESRIIGALAFFSREVREPDERLLELAHVIGSELGQFLQLKRAEEQVRALNADLELRVAARTRELEIANNELESFAYSVSHDLRAPLRAIEGFSSLIEKDYRAQLDERAQDYFRRVRGGAVRMGRLIDDLLNLSRISRQEMQIGEINLSALASEIVEDLQVANPERKVEWIIAPEVKANGDLGLLRAVLQNLIGNAWKYSSKVEAAHIEFGVSSEDGRVAYFVRDNGAGFDMAYADKLFGAFQRLHSPEEFPGTGIGLATVKRIIHRHGGEVWAEGKASEGATFYFSL